MEEQEEKPATKNQQTGVTDCVNEGNLRQANGNKVRKYSKSGSPPKENLPFQQDTPMFQWTCPTQQAREQDVHRSPLSKQVPSFTINKWQTPLSHSQTNSANSGSHIAHYNQTQLAPAGNTYLPFSPVAPGSSSWQTSVVINESSSGIEPVPAYCYQGGYSYPIGFSGPWYPSYLWCHSPQSPYTIHYPAGFGGCGYYTSPAPVSEGQPGNIRPLGRLSQKHQQMWKAQSAENVYLRSALNCLEAEVATCRSRLMQLETDVASFKSQNKSLIGSGGPCPIQPSRRGRPKKSIALGDAKPFSHDTQAKTHGRKRTQDKMEARNKEGILSSEKDVPCKEQDVDDYIISSNVAKDSNFQRSSGNKLMLPPDISMPLLFHNRASQTNRAEQSGNAHLPMSAVHDNSIMDENQNSKVGISVPSPDVKLVEGKYQPASYNVASSGWQAKFVPEEYSLRNMLDSKGEFFNGNNVSLDKGRIFFPVWRCASETVSEHADVIGSDQEEEEGTGENSNSAGDR